MVFGISRIDPISELECQLASYVETEYAICTSMGRTALLVLLKSIGISTGDEVIVPAYICEVVPNAVLKAGATPIFVDINSEN
ncbi:MAG: aminotransferase class I/II-fold pyridoxal phosphate-dependent enzyme, partial [Methanothrix sp.]|nr:aminotransferase class I/II-fold pyridoxal phosphate-dependent enzyme [Methanothrix sp.]